MQHIPNALLLALLVGAPALANDLGRADIKLRNDLPITSKFDALCVGPMDKWEGPECVVRFSDSKMFVDDSRGISKDQIISFSTHWNPESPKYIDVLYKTSTGEISIAQFSFKFGNRAKQFVNTLIIFMSGKSLNQ